MAAAESLLFITGAGISAPSGIPTYRGIGGLYNDADPEEGLSIEEALSGEMLRRRPEITWRYIHQIEKASRGKTFNRGHELIALAEQRCSRVWVLTQNVDGFHKKAGSRNVIDIHGDIHELRCTGCDGCSTVDDYRELAPLPMCSSCGEVVRPEVVLFGELLPFEKVELMRKELKRGFDVVFSVGTTSVFPYIMEPVVDAGRRGKLTVEINPGRTTLSDDVDVRLAEGAVTALEDGLSRLLL